MRNREGVWVSALWLRVMTPITCALIVEGKIMEVENSNIHKLEEMYNYTENMHNITKLIKKKESIGVLTARLGMLKASEKRDEIFEELLTLVDRISQKHSKEYSQIFSKISEWYFILMDQIRILEEENLELKSKGSKNDN